MCYSYCPAQHACPTAVQRTTADSPYSILAAGCVGATLAEQQARLDLGRHQEVMETVSAFAMQLHDHMQTRTDKGVVTQAPELAQACGETAGMHLQHSCFSLWTRRFHPGVLSYHN